MTVERPKLKDVLWKRPKQAIRVILEKVKDIGKDKASPLMDQAATDARLLEDVTPDDMFPGGRPF